jgi:hypothetical protein
METRILKEMIRVVKAEQQRREAQLDAMDSDYQYDRWQFVDLPLLSEMYLMILVALRHQVERELIRIAARSGGHEISVAEYQANLQKERALLRRKDGWKNLDKRLKLTSYHGNKYVEALRLLSNSYKHGPAIEPEKKLLQLLGLGTNVKYAPMPESNSLREALGRFVGLTKDAAFCDIAEQFVGQGSDYVDAVRRKMALSTIKRERVPLNLADFLH